MKNYSRRRSWRALWVARDCVAFSATTASVWCIFPCGGRQGADAGGDGVEPGGGVAAAASHEAAPAYGEVEEGDCAYI